MIAPKNAIHPMRYMLGGTMITPAQLKIFWKCIDEGAAIVGAAKTAGFSLPSGYNIHREQRGRELVKPKGKGQSHHWSQRAGLNKDPRTQGHQEANLPDPIALDDISLDARDALEDFHYFSERYFGRVPTPWRREAADVTLKLYDDEDKRHAVVNCPPGSGKTALFTHDIPAWLTMRDRAIRGVLGSWGMSTSGSYTRRLRTTFDRTALVPVSEDLIAKGMERQPSGVLAADFGRIKPLGQSDFWTANSFTVEQLDGRAPADKEPTWTAFGNGEIIGWRVDFLIFDDLVTVRKLDSEAEQQRTRRWWDDEVEKRLEPGGLLLLEGQRLGANDHYRYCLDKLDIDEDDLEVLDGFDPDFEEGRRRKYHHIIFKAHYEDKCSGGNSREPHHHPATAKPYPDGCLLDPARLKFRDLKREEAENPSRYMTVFQQEDTNPDQVLIPRHWIDGDADHPGCWDKDRDSWELPSLEGPVITVVSVDPSPTKNWAVQAWAYHPNSETYFLLDLFRGEMTQPSFLYGERDDYSGLLEDIRKDFEARGRPLRHVIFEKNVAQRWFLQQPYVEKWKRKHQVRIHDHETHHRNKSDPKYGITMLRPLFEHGQIRLPGVQVPPGGSPKDYTGRRNSIKLTNELTRYSLLYGASGTDDQIMAAWMMAHKARTLRTPDPTSMPRLNQYVAGWMVKRKPAA